VDRSYYEYEKVEINGSIINNLVVYNLGHNLYNILSLLTMYLILLNI
jgi:hypothetical protein